MQYLVTLITLFTFCLPAHASGPWVMMAAMKPAPPAPPVVSETFDNSSIDSTLWGTVTGGAGTVAETSVLTLNCSSTADRAYVYFKTAVSLSQRYKYTFRVKTDTAVEAQGGIATVSLWSSASPSAIPATGSPDTRVGQISMNGAGVSGSAVAGYFTSGGTWTPTTGTVPAAGTYVDYVVEVDSTASKIRLSINQTSGTTIATTGWIALGTVRTGANPIYLVLGDIYDSTSTVYGDAVATSFTQVAF